MMHSMSPIYKMASTFTEQVAIQIETDFEASIGTEVMFIYVESWLISKSTNHYTITACWFIHHSPTILDIALYTVKFDHCL